MGRAGVDQRAQHARRSAARAQQQNTLATQADPGVLLDIVNQADAVGVVGQDLPVLEAQDVAGLRQQAALAGLAGQRCCIKFEGDGDVAAAAAFVHEDLHAMGQVVQRYQPLGVDQGLPGQLGKAGVNPGRLAVGNRIAHDAIQIRCHGGVTL
ncbi:hypothetical protein GALL_448060 [mine drainage metagenome]|uniref:Uncharacterized protein n=1 Tax=mine drainage metagenome TaxID=410659 RepID=A0A1J5PQX5_9ZZZZ